MSDIEGLRVVPRPRRQDEPGAVVDLPGDPGAARRARIRRAMLVCGTYLALSVFAFIRAWTGGPTRKLQVPTGDLATYIWGLRWVAYAISHGHNPFYTNWLNYPHGVNLLNNTLPMLLGVVISPVTLAFGPVASYNVLQTVAVAASASAAYLLLRRWTSWWPAAFVGGLFYGFSPYMFGAGWGHLYLLFTPLPPLIVLCLDELLVRQRGSAKRWGAGLGLLVVAQFFCSSEMLADTAELCVIGVGLLALLHRDQIRSRFRHAATGLITGAGVAAALLAYPAWFVVLGPQHVRITSPADLFSSDLLGPIVPTSNQLLNTPALRHLGDKFSGYPIPYMGRTYLVTDQAYLGLPLLAILVVTAIRLRRLAIVRFFALMSVVAFIVSLGPTLKIAHHSTGIPMPARLLAHMPLLGATFPNRFALHVSLGVAVLFAVAVDQLHEKTSHRWPSGVGGRLVMAGVVVAALAPLVPPLPYSMLTVKVPEYYRTSIAAIPRGSVLLSYPFPGPLAAEPMLWQADTGMRYRMVGGYAFVQDGKGGWTLSDNPSVTQSLLTTVYTGGTVPAVTPSLRQQLRGDLGAWHVSTVVVVTSAPSATSVVSLFTDVLGRSPQYQQDAAVWYQLPSRSAGPATASG